MVVVPVPSLGGRVVAGPAVSGGRHVARHRPSTHGAPCGAPTVPAVVDDTQYEYTSVQALRGTEAKAIAKWGRNGWEVQRRDPGVLRTELTFRRVKPKTLGGTLLAAFRTLNPKMQLLAAAAPVLLLVAVITIGAIAEGRGGASEPAASASDAEVSAEPAHAAAATSSAAPTTPAAEEILTVANNADLAALLAITQPGAPTVGEFAAKYRGRTIEFDGNIAFMNGHGGYSTRYDLLILAGDFSTTTSAGPNFQFRDVNLTSDLKLVGPNVPDTVGKGDNLRIVARVGDYNSTQELLVLEPVSLASREAAPVAPQAVAEPPQAVTRAAPAAPEPVVAAPQAPASTYYKNCDAARAAGAAPVRAGDPGYGKHLDREGDGVGCE
ncbi:UNVERIFIED_ORG: DUF4839 domain-containing protein [Bacillus sp. AZ43]